MMGWKERLEILGDLTEILRDTGVRKVLTEDQRARADRLLAKLERGRDDRRGAEERPVGLGEEKLPLQPAAKR